MDVYGLGTGFCQIWSVSNLLKQVLGPFFMVIDLFFTFTFGPGTGPKWVPAHWYLKG